MPRLVLDTDLAYTGKVRPVTVDSLPSTGIVSAHRTGGGPTGDVPAVAPEGTIAGAWVSLGLGAHILDVDIRTTADGGLVVMHDTTVDRTTYGKGNVSDHVLNALPAIASARFLGEGWLDEPMSTLEQFFNAFGGRAVMTVEAKNGVPDVVPLANLIKKYGLEKSVFINSNNNTVIAAIVAQGILAHLWAWSDTSLITPGIAAGASLLEVPYNTTGTIVTQCQTAVANPAVNLRWFIAGPIDTRAKVAGMTSGIMGHVSDALGMTNRSTGAAPLVNKISPSLMAGKRGIGWRYYTVDGNGLVPKIVPSYGLKWDTQGSSSTATSLRGIYLGDMSGTMPSSYTMTMKFVPDWNWCDRSVTLNSVRFRSACTIADAGGQDSDTDGYIPILNSDGRLRLYTSVPGFGAGTLIYDEATVIDFIPGTEYSLSLAITATQVRVSASGANLSKPGSLVTNNTWRGQHHYIWNVGMKNDSMYITEFARS